MIVGRDTGRLDETGVSKAAKMKITFILISYHGIHRIDCLIKKAQTEAVCAGALSIQLAGDAWYFGKLVKKPFIGDALRPVEYEDIRRANRLLYATAFLCEGICLLVMGLLFFI